MRSWQQQQECDRRIAEIKQQEENILRNLTQAWQYNVNDRYYPTGKLEGNDSGRQTGQSGFAQSASTLSTSFGSSPFGAMPASSFSLGSRDTTNPQHTNAFQPPTNNAFGQPRPAFGTPSTLGTQTSTFGAKPTFGTPVPTQPTFSQPSMLVPSQSTFGQPSTLGVSGLPPPPAIGLVSTPTFGQPSALGALGSSTPTFGQASSFSSPFAGGLGRLGGSTFGAKSNFGTFGANQPSAFAQAGMGNQNAFMQSSNQSGFNAPSALAGGKPDSFGENRFTVLSETTDSVAGDKDDDMADEMSPVLEKTNNPLQSVSPLQPTAPLQHAPPQPELPQPVGAVAPGQPLPTLADAFGGLSTKSGIVSETTSEKSTTPVKTAEPKPVSAVPVNNSKSQSNGIDEMAAWMANEFTIGGIPEREPPLEVR
jgi:hypothetical protein